MIFHPCALFSCHSTCKIWGIIIIEFISGLMVTDLFPKMCPKVGWALISILRSTKCSWHNVSCHKTFPVKNRFLSKKTFLDTTFFLSINVSYHKRFLSQTVPVTNVSCHKHFLSQNVFLHKTFSYTKRFLTQNVSCHKTFPVTKRFSKNVSSTKSLMTQNVSSTKCSLLLKDVSCYKMFTFINVSNLCLFV